MRKDITTNILIDGGEKINKSALARQYGCCWRTIDRRLNPKIEKEIKEKVITSKNIIRYIKSLKGMLMTYQNLENVPATKSQIRNVIDELNLLEAALWQTLKMSKKAIK